MLLQQIERCRGLERREDGEGCSGDGSRGGLEEGGGGWAKENQASVGGETNLAFPHSSLKHPTFFFIVNQTQATTEDVSRVALDQMDLMAHTGPEIILCNRFGDICYCCS